MGPIGGNSFYDAMSQATYEAGSITMLWELW